MRSACLDVNRLRGDATKARRELGWKPTVEFADLVQMMVDADLERVAHEIAEQANTTS